MPIVVVQEHGSSEVTNTGESLNIPINQSSRLSRSGTPSTIKSRSAKSPKSGSIPETGEEESSASEVKLSLLVTHQPQQPLHTTKSLLYLS